MTATEWKIRILLFILLQSEIWLLSTCIPIKTTHFTAPTRFPSFHLRFTTPTPIAVWTKSARKDFDVDHNHRDSTTATIWVIYTIVFLVCLLIFLLKNFYCFLMDRSESESQTTESSLANRNSLSTITVPHTTENSGGVDNEAFFQCYGISSTADKPPGYSDVLKSDSKTGGTQFPEVFPQTDDEMPPPKYDETIWQRY